MKIARLHVDGPLASGDTLTLRGDRVHYLARVLRLKVGAALNVFNDSEGEFAATLEALDNKRARVQLGEPTGADHESPLVTWLAQGLCRAQRMDYCVQKATEVGVTRVVPIVTERCVVRLPEAKVARRVEHWRGIAVSACEQSLRTRIPNIEAPQPLHEFLARSDRPALAVLDPAAGAGVADWRVTDNAIAMMIGPEGGFSEDEHQALAAADAARWRMGPRVLRTETAGPVALALLQSRLGDMG